ncbi:spore coat protein GerQ [Pasteuria penetrans]|uniref:spore coat protein GerQ n=1 Tax=Pasteuria penetrans TaxID=86005 RepID=UPI000FA3FFAE
MYWYNPYHNIPEYHGKTPTVVPISKKRKTYAVQYIQTKVGKKVTAYMTYEGETEGTGKVFSGILREVGNNYFVISERTPKKNIMLLTINLDYMVVEANAKPVPGQTSDSGHHQVTSDTNSSVFLR